MFAPKVAKFAGFKWRRLQSSEFEAEETHLTRTGNPYLRYHLCEAANTVRTYAPEYAAYYERKYREVRLHQHKRAIVLTARKLSNHFFGHLGRTARRLSRTQRRRAGADASVGSDRWLGRRERGEQGRPAGAARRAVKPTALRSA